jgi:fructose-specific phosphotransferase system IIC component
MATWSVAGAGLLTYLIESFFLCFLVLYTKEAMTNMATTRSVTVTPITTYKAPMSTKKRKFEIFKKEKNKTQVYLLLFFITVGIICKRKKSQSTG